jgi:predicted DNA-binding mobile mystery protein A
MKKDKLVRLQIDKQLNVVKSIININRPLYGWIKTIRTALGMTTAQFAKRMGVSRARISFMEASEIEDSLTIRTLREAAASLNCRLIYFLVPEKTLEEMVKEQAIKTVAEDSKNVTHSMELENQAILEKDSKDFIDIQAETLMFEHPNKVWES